MRSERVAEEVEALLAGVFQRSLGLVESEPELRHRIAHPRQRLGGTAATEDDEIIGIGDDMGNRHGMDRPPICVENTRDVVKQLVNSVRIQRLDLMCLAVGVSSCWLSEHRLGELWARTQTVKRP